MINFGPLLTQIAGIHVKLNQLRDELEQCVTNQDFARAAELKQEITDLEEQKETLDSEENFFSQTVRSEEKVCRIKYFHNSKLGVGINPSLTGIQT